MSRESRAAAASRGVSTLQSGISPPPTEATMRSAESGSSSSSSSSYSAKASSSSSRSVPGVGSLDGKYWSSRTVSEDGRRRSSRRVGGGGSEASAASGDFREESRESVNQSGESGCSASAEARVEGESLSASAVSKARPYYATRKKQLSFRGTSGAGEEGSDEAEASREAGEGNDQSSLVLPARQTRGLRLRSSGAVPLASESEVAEREVSGDPSPPPLRSTLNRTTRSAAAAGPSVSLSASRKSALHSSHPQWRVSTTESEAGTLNSPATATPLLQGEGEKEETKEEGLEREASGGESELEETPGADEETGLRYGLRSHRIASAKRELSLSSVADETPSQTHGPTSGAFHAPLKRRRPTSPSAGVVETTAQQNQQQHAGGTKGENGSSHPELSSSLADKTSAAAISNQTGVPLSTAHRPNSLNGTDTSNGASGPVSVGRRKFGPGRPRLHPLGPRAGVDGKPLTLSYSIPWNQALADFGKKASQRNAGVLEVAMPFGHFYDPRLLLPDVEEARGCVYTREYLRQKSLFQQAMRQQQLEEEEQALQSASNNTNSTNNNASNNNNNNNNSASGEEAAAQGSSDSSDEEEASVEAGRRDVSGSQISGTSNSASNNSSSTPSASAGASVSSSSATTTTTSTTTNTATASSSSKQKSHASSSAPWRRGGRRRCRRGPRQGPVLVSYGSQQFQSWTAVSSGGTESGSGAPFQRGRILCGFGSDERAESYWAAVRCCSGQSSLLFPPFPPNPLTDEGSLLEVLSTECQKDACKRTASLETTRALQVSALRLLQCGFALREASAVEGALAMTRLPGLGKNSESNCRSSLSSSVALQEVLPVAALAALSPESVSRGFEVAKADAVFRREFVSLLLSASPRLLFEGLAQRRCRSGRFRRAKSAAIDVSGKKSFSEMQISRFFDGWKPQTSIQIQREAALELESAFPHPPGGSNEDPATLANSLQTAGVEALPPLIFEAQAFGSWDDGILAFSSTPLTWMKPSLEWTTTRRVAAGGPLNPAAPVGATHESDHEDEGDGGEADAEDFAKDSTFQLPRGPAWRTLWSEVEEHAVATASSGGDEKKSEVDNEKREDRDGSAGLNGTSSGSNNINIHNSNNANNSNINNNNNSTGGWSAGTTGPGGGGAPRPSSLSTERQNALRLRLEEKKQLLPPAPPDDPYALSADYASVYEALWHGAGAYLVPSLEEHCESVVAWDERRNGRDANAHSAFGFSSFQAKRKASSSSAFNKHSPAALSRPDAEYFLSLYIQPEKMRKGSHSSRSKKRFFSTPQSSSSTTTAGSKFWKAGVSGGSSTREALSLSSSLGGPGGAGAGAIETRATTTTTTSKHETGAPAEGLGLAGVNLAGGGFSLRGSAAGPCLIAEARVGGEVHGATRPGASSSTGPASSLSSKSAGTGGGGTGGGGGGPASQSVVSASSAATSGGMSQGPSSSHAASQASAVGTAAATRKSPLAPVDGLLELVRSQRALLSGVAGNAMEGTISASSSSTSTTATPSAGTAEGGGASGGVGGSAPSSSCGSVIAQSASSSSAPVSSSRQNLQLELDILRVLSWRLRHELAAAAQQPDVGPRKLASKVRLAQSELAASASAVRAAAVSVAEIAGESLQDWEPSPLSTSGSNAENNAGATTTGGTVGRKKRVGRAAKTPQQQEDADTAEDREEGDGQNEGSSSSSSSSSSSAATAEGAASALSNNDASTAISEGPGGGGRPRRSAAGSRMATFVTLLKRGSNAIEPLGVPGEEALVAAAALANSNAGASDGTSVSDATAQAALHSSSLQSKVPSDAQGASSSASPNGATCAEPSLRQLWNSLAAELKQKVEANGKGGSIPVDSLQRVLTTLSLSGAAARLGVHRSTISRWLKIWNLKRPSATSSSSHAGGTLPHGAGEFAKKEEGATLSGKDRLGSRFRSLGGSLTRASNTALESTKNSLPDLARSVQLKMAVPDALKDSGAETYFVSYEGSSAASSSDAELARREQCASESSVSRLVPQIRRTLDGLVDAVCSVGAAAKESGDRVESLLPKASEFAAEATQFHDQAQALREHIELQQQSSLTNNPFVLALALISAAAFALCIFGAAIPWGVGLGAAGFTAGGIAFLRKRKQERRRDADGNGESPERRSAV